MNDPAYVAAYQGIAGAFSECAARAWVGAGPPLLACPTLLTVFEAVASGRAAAGVVPVHNSIAGPVPGARELMTWFGLSAERWRPLPIDQVLIGPPSATMASIREVWSHPVALRQCTAFLVAHAAWRQQGWFDTAGAVRDVVALGDPAIGAIGPVAAAAMYGGRVLARGVQDRADNVTTFAWVEALRYE